MNERIKELVEQATEKIANDGKDLWLGKPHYRLVFNKEKFAELIVRKCIECTKEWRDAPRDKPNEDYWKGYEHGCDDAIVEMKTRFGVEE